MAVYLIIFALILLLGTKVAPKEEFHEDFLSLKLSKGIQGFCAICIIAHHFVQPYMYSGEGAGPMTFFALIGFLFVCVFFFFSGYRLFKSYKTKPDYLKGFLKKRLPVVLVPLYVINTIFTVIVLATGGTLYNDMNPLVMGMDNIMFRITTFLGITLMNSNAWYMITIAMFYIVFYFAFRNNRNEDTAFRIIGIFSVVYIAAGLMAGHGIFWLQGEWWYNSSFLLFIGMYVAKNEEKIISFIKRKYSVMVSVLAIATPIMTIAAIIATSVLSYYRPGLEGIGCSIVCLFFETSAGILFTSLILVITMKVRINNIILDFLGSIALEVYLVHRFFIVAFNTEYIIISNQILYLAAVYGCTIVAAIILHQIDGVIVGLIKGKKTAIRNNASLSAGK
ncbi:acyltransferase [uncultured Clostridium sp.]|uniref:acyltransferase family protein n=1 Tax=uncultured Clostridium sp. TaxID=59620 RepID=UPI0025E65141|nr:acyltransferase [uncultured Clostridium sp.]